MKNGFLFVVSLLVIGGAVFGIKKFLHDNNHYSIVVEVRKPEGVSQGDKIDYHGIDVGDVLLVEEGDETFFVTLEIQKRVQVPQGSRISMNRIKELDESVVRIAPSRRKEFYADGDTVALPEIDIIGEMKKLGTGVKGWYTKGREAFEEELVPYIDSLMQEYESSKEQ